MGGIVRLNMTFSDTKNLEIKVPTEETYTTKATFSYIKRYFLR